MRKEREESKRPGLLVMFLVCHSLFTCVSASVVIAQQFMFFGFPFYPHRRTHQKITLSDTIILCSLFYIMLAQQQTSFSVSPPLFYFLLKCEANNMSWVHGIIFHSVVHGNPCHGSGTFKRRFWKTALLKRRPHGSLSFSLSSLFLGTHHISLSLISHCHHHHQPLQPSSSSTTFSFPLPPLTRLIFLSVCSQRFVIYIIIHAWFIIIKVDILREHWSCIFFPFYVYVCMCRLSGKRRHAFELSTMWNAENESMCVCSSAYCLPFFLPFSLMRGEPRETDEINQSSITRFPPTTFSPLIFLNVHPMHHRITIIIVINTFWLWNPRLSHSRRSFITASTLPWLLPPIMSKNKMMIVEHDHYFTLVFSHSEFFLTEAKTPTLPESVYYTATFLYSFGCVIKIVPEHLKVKQNY